MGTTSVSIETDNFDDLQLALYEDKGGDCNDFNNLEEVAANDDSEVLEAPNIICATVSPLTRYYIQLDGSFDTESSGGIRVTPCVEFCPGDSSSFSQCGSTIYSAATLTAANEECCGALLYDRENYFCCGASIVEYISGAESCCDYKTPYDSDTEICCDGSVSDKPSDNSECCGGKPFDADSFSCCGENTIYSSSNDLCCDDTAVSFDTAETHVCCGATAIPKDELACCENVDDGTAVPFDDSCQECCSGSVVDGNECFCTMDSGSFVDICDPGKNLVCVWKEGDNELKQKCVSESKLDGALPGDNFDGDYYLVGCDCCPSSFEIVDFGTFDFMDKKGKSVDDAAYELACSPS